MIDYRDYYNLEDYLFENVGPRFGKTGSIDPLDFYLILTWKANRATTIHRDRLRQHKGGFTGAVKRSSADLYKYHSPHNPKAQLRSLTEKWHFRLPTASAILSVLYPNIFTIYDKRVCQQLNAPKYLAEQKNFEKLWTGYEEFRARVQNNTPKQLSLRDRDRYLWGKSFYESAMGSLNAYSVVPMPPSTLRLAPVI